MTGRSPSTMNRSNARSRKIFCPSSGSIRLSASRSRRRSVLILRSSISCDVRYPFVATTYRVTEHWQTGVMTRHSPWLLEMQPQQFVEMSRELAAEKGIKNGDRAEGDHPPAASSAPWPWSPAASNPSRSAARPCIRSACPGVSDGSIPEIRKRETAPIFSRRFIGDANTMIPESKAFMVNVQKA